MRGSTRAAGGYLWTWAAGGAFELVRCCIFIKNVFNNFLYGEWDVQGASYPRRPQELRPRHSRSCLRRASAPICSISRCRHRAPAGALLHMRLCRLGRRVVVRHALPGRVVPLGGVLRRGLCRTQTNTCYRCPGCAVRQCPAHHECICRAAAPPPHHGPTVWPNRWRPWSHYKVTTQRQATAASRKPGEAKGRHPSTQVACLSAAGPANRSGATPSKKPAQPSSNRGQYPQGYTPSAPKRLRVARSTRAAVRIVAATAPQPKSPQSDCVSRGRSQAVCADIRCA